MLFCWLVLGTAQPFNHVAPAALLCDIDGNLNITMFAVMEKQPLKNVEISSSGSASKSHLRTRRKCSRLCARYVSASWMKSSCLGRAKNGFVFVQKLDHIQSIAVSCYMQIAIALASKQRRSKRRFACNCRENLRRDASQIY